MYRFLASVAGLSLSIASAFAAGPTVVPAITFPDSPGVVYISARQASKILGLRYDFDPRSDLAFLGHIPLGHESEVAGERFVRVTALKLEGAAVTSKKSETLVKLGNRALVAVPGPKRAFVSKTRQNMSIFQGGNLLFTTPVSTGKYSRSTPVGHFRVGSSKDAYHSSSKYGDAPMPWAVHVTRNIFIHGGTVPNYPASHGCIRLPMDAAQWFFRWAQPGTVVVIGQ